MRKLISIAAVLAGVNAAAELQPMTKQQADSLLANKTTEISSTLATTPKDYSFKNQTGDLSVAYIGQTFRQVLISRAKPAFGQFQYGGRPGAEESVFNQINSIYQFNAAVTGLQPHGMKALNLDGTLAFIYEGDRFAEIYEKGTTLKEKIAGNDNDLRYGKMLGWNTDEIAGVPVDGAALVETAKGSKVWVQGTPDGVVTPDDLYSAMMRAVAKAASGTEQSFTVKNPGHADQTITAAHVTPEGIDLAQLSQKLLHGAVSFSQAAGDYVAVDLKPGKGLTADNEALINKKPYTVLQHHWDEAFGYFGAARNFLDYTDDQIYNCDSSSGKKICKSFSIDAYSSVDVEDPATLAVLYTDHFYGEEDGLISLMSEANLGMSVNAAKRDKGATLGNMDFTKSIVTPLIEGRHLIQEKPEGYLEYSQALGVQAMHEWERLLAATSIHYINETLDDYEQYGTADYKFTDLAKHWSELKGFAFAFQFNPASVMFVDATGNKSTNKFLELHALIADAPMNPASSTIDTYKTNLEKARQILQDTYSFDEENVKAW